MPQPLFIDSPDTARAAGAYAVEVTPPRVIEDQVVGYVGIVMQSEWGPDNEVGEPAGSADFLNTYFPAGSPRTSTGYLALVGRKKMPLRPVRVMKSDAVAAYRSITVTGGSLEIVAKYKGTLGNSITTQVKNATDGNVLHFDLEVVLTDAVTGTTKGVIRNCVIDTDPELPGAEALLLESVSWSGTPTARPANDGSPVALTGGSNGTGSVGATEYNAGVALLAPRDEVHVVLTDDCGSSARAAVNANLLTHAQTTTRSRVVVMQDDQNASWSTVKTNVASYRGDRVVYVGAWAKVYDDTGTLQNSPWSTFIASAIVNMEPQESHAWWDDKVTALYLAVRGTYAPFDTNDPDVQAEATEQGICIPTRLESGRFALLHDRTTSLTTGRRYTTTRRIKDFLARSMLSTIRSFVNGPSLRGRHLEVKGLINVFLRGQVTKQRVVAFSTDIDTVNTAEQIALGHFSVGIDATTPSVMEKIFLLLNAGETVTVRDAS